MGKPTPPTAARDAFPLHPQPSGRYSDNDAPELPNLNLNLNLNHGDDLPPLYEEATEARNSAAAPLLPEQLSSQPQHLPIPGLGTEPLQPFRRDETTAYYLDSRLDADADLLEKQIRSWATIPPRPSVRIRGTHTSHHRDREGKKESRKIVDFDVSVELTPYLCPDGGVTQANCELRTVENGEKARRGGICRRRAPRARARASGRLELGLDDLERKPRLAEWCHMYCASHSWLKTFQLKKQVVGFDEQRVRQHLEDMVRRTNYRGNLETSFPVRDEKVEVWNECRGNRWRLTHWILLLFCLTFLWILTWPLLFFMTKKYETVSAVWHYSTLDEEGRKQYVTLSEDQWYNLGGRAISKAVLMKRQGMLNQQDLLAAEGAPPGFNDASNLVNAGINAMNAVNRQLGWGMSDF